MDKWLNFTASGDSLIVKHIPQGYPGFDKVKEFLYRGDARITNLETTLTDGNCFASSFSGGTWVTAPEEVLDDLREYGFNMYGWANNHTMDYSYEGLLSTKRALQNAHLVHAGAGENLFEASRPGIIELPSARVGLISICSTFDPSARAGKQSESLHGRPGLNPLRFQTIYRVNREHMQALKEIAKATGANGRNNLSIQYGFRLPVPDGQFELDSIRFEENEKEGRFTQCNKTDLERTTMAIQDCLKTVDYVVIMVHSHEIKADTNEDADFFLEEFARACIDAGACAVLGGGTHQLKGIEIYRGKPIFYSLGNFIFQNEYVRVLPPDFCEKHHFPENYTASQGIAARTASARGVSMHADLNNFRSVLPYFRMEDERCVCVELLPVSLGHDKPMNFRNLPYAANEDESKEIMEYLERVSKPYGTNFCFRDGKIVVDLTRSVENEK